MIQTNISGYVAGDATKTYRSSKAEEVTRQFIFVMPNCFVIFDRVGSTQKEFLKDFILRTGNLPSINKKEKQIKVFHRDGEMLLTTLLPKNPSFKVIKGFKVNDISYPIAQINKYTPEEQTYLGRYRVELSDSKQEKYTYFLSFIQVGKKGKLQEIQPKLLNKNAMAGIKFSYNAVTYSFWFKRKGRIGGSYLLQDNKKWSDNSRRSIQK